MESLLVPGKLNFEMLNENEDLVQVVLMPDQGVYTEAGSIQYFSSGVSIRDFGPSWLNRFFKPDYGLRLRVKNRKGGVEYVGLSKGSGKVIAINPSIFNETFMFDTKFLLAYSSNIKTHVHDLEFKSFRNVHFVQVKGNDAVFVQANTGLVEKKLGNDEEFHVQIQNLVGFSNQVKFEKSLVLHGFERYFISSPKFVKVIGPGIIFFVAPSNLDGNNKEQRRGFTFENMIFIGILLLLYYYEIGMFDWILT
jgi:uncharacterized protein (AIM24 family)